jgi:hypothetical protein
MSWRYNERVRECCERAYHKRHVALDAKLYNQRHSNVVNSAGLWFVRSFVRNDIPGAKSVSQSCNGGATKKGL